MSRLRYTRAGESRGARMRLRRSQSKRSIVLPRRRRMLHKLPRRSKRICLQSIENGNVEKH